VGGLQALVLLVPALLPAPQHHADVVLHGGQDGVEDADLGVVALVAVPRQHHNALAAVVDDGAVDVRRNAVVHHALPTVIRAKLGAHLPALVPERGFPRAVLLCEIGSLRAEGDAGTQAAEVFGLHAVEEHSQWHATSFDFRPNVADVCENLAWLTER
jgi:hypothetical protein